MKKKDYKNCNKCNSSSSYSAEYDSFACIKCDAWLENKACNNNDCDFCIARPATPKNVETESLESLYK